MAKKQEISYTSPNEGFWTIPDINYRGESRTYRLFEKMIPRITQEQLSEFYEQEKAKGNPRPMDSILHFAIMNASYNLRDQNPKETERLRRFLQTDFQEYKNTLTRVIYSPSGKDKVIHNYRTSDEYSIDGKVVGPNDWIENMSDKKVLKSLLGTQDVVQIDKISQWINGTNSFICRFNSKPKTKDERVARFGTDDYALLFDCDRFTILKFSAFRVLRVD